MRLPCLQCFLILLVISAEVDETWTAGFAVPIFVPDDDDDYLPSEQQECREQLFARQILAIRGPGLRVADTRASLMPGDARCQSMIPGYVSSLSLYALMSLQR